MVARFLASTSANGASLLGKDAVEQCQVDHFLQLARLFKCGQRSDDDVKKEVHQNLKSSGHVVLGRTTLADLVLWSAAEAHGDVSNFGSSYF